VGGIQWRGGDSSGAEHSALCLGPAATFTTALRVLCDITFTAFS
jgi:hypothetical protein